MNLKRNLCLTKHSCQVAVCQPPAAMPTVQFKGFALELNGAAARIWGNEAPKQNCGLPTTTAIPCGGGKPPLR